MRNKFPYSCSIKICASGFHELVESIFCLLLVVEAFSLEKVVKMLGEVVVNWQEVRWIWWMRQNFIAQFIELLKCWLCDTQLQKLNKLGYKVLPHPPYSPDLLPTNNHFFKHLDTFLWEKHFHNQQDAENVFQEFIESQEWIFMLQE